MNQRSNIRIWLVLAFGPIVLYSILYAWPILRTLRTSFDGFDALSGSIPDFQLGFYEKLLTDSFYLGVLWRTIRLSLTITVVCVVAGFPVSYFLAKATGRLRTVLLIVLLVPLVTSPVVVAYGWLVLLGSKGLVNEVLIGVGLTNSPVKLIFTELSLIIGLVHVLATFAVLPMAASLRAIDWNLVLAARSLGASGLRVFLHVVLPLALPGVATGSLIVFSLSMSAYAVPVLVAGPQVKVMSELIYQQGMALLNWPFGAAMAVVLVASTTGVMALSGGVSRWWQHRILKRTRMMAEA